MIKEARRKAIVFGADSNYMEKLEVAIKSVCVHNRNVRFYIFNDDIPTEWFQLMSKHLKMMGAEIINVKIVEHTLKNYRLPAETLSYAAFFRYFIPDYVTEDRALYLDSDMIVTMSLDALFAMDLEGQPLAAVQDVGVFSSRHYFNSGFLLIDTEKWREEDAVAKLFDLTNQYHQTAFGDQDILNMLFENRWKTLPKHHNLMVGLDAARLVSEEGWYDVDATDRSPKIIHYTTAQKPWQELVNNRYRDLWWFYYGLDWSDVIVDYRAANLTYADIADTPIFHTCIFTDTYEMEHLEYLIQRLPQVQFSILAWTGFHSSVMGLQKYLNVKLYPHMTPFNKQEVFEHLDFYLDINYHGEVDGIIGRVHQMEKPIFGFRTTSHDVSGKSHLYEISEVDQMVTAIEAYLAQQD